ncbi:unnamed protein product [Arctia plantaginis]|uniref:Activating transcription factor 7-interacting protein Fn3 domain-containing protein n=1 Tax=Arctia plantaginis TaxID=874455 RepID=A0A8S0YQ04_ARCPL|nr:unnamed protein product [Arctia plantaginis]
MATVKNIQNNKTDDLKTLNVDIDNLQDKKVNGNERDLNLNGDSKGDGREEVITEIDDTSADVPMTTSNNEVELSETPTHENEEINEKSLNGFNSSDLVQNDIMEIDESKETLEEDYLEDDIISIVEEPRTEVTENVIFETHDVTVKDEVDDGKKELIKIEEIAVVDVIKDEEEVKVEAESNPEQSVKDVELQTPIEENDTDHVMSESQETCPIQGKKETHKLTTQEEDEVIIEKTDSVSVQNESSIVSSLNGNDKIDVIDESDSSHVPINEINETESVKTTENNEIVGVILEANHSLACEKNIVSPTEQSKEDEIQVVEETKITPAIIEDENGHIDIAEETEGHSIQSNNIIDIEIQKETESTKHITDTLVSPSSETHDIEIIEDLNKAGDQDKNETESYKEVKETENTIEPEENVNTEKTCETSKCESDVQESNTNAINTHIDKPFMEVEKITEVAAIAAEPKSSNKDDTDVNRSTPVNVTTVNIIDKPIICKLSNTLDILSDDDEDPPQMSFEKTKPPKVDSPKPPKDANNKCIDLEDDDDIMVIDEDADKTETKSPEDTEVNKETTVQTDTNTDLGNDEKTGQETVFESHDKEETTTPSAAGKDLNMEIDIREKTPESEINKDQPLPPLIPGNFVKTAKKKLSDMTRDDLEEFCILKIVEGIVDRSNLNDIQNKLKSMTHGLDEYRKKVMMLAKQNRDLQLVLKSVQEEQKKGSGGTPIAPLKITRSVGMQVYMEKIPPRKKGQLQNSNNKNLNNTQNKNLMPLGQGIRSQKQVSQSTTIPVPRLVPASNPALKTPNTIPQINQMNTTPVKNINPPNGIIKTPSPAMRAEKRQHNKVASSMTVDLTDDEPPTKMPGGPKTSPVPPVRLVPPQNLMGPQRQPFATNVNSPRKVYIPISGPQNQALRPGQTIMLKTVPASGIRPRTPQVARGDPNAARMARIAPRHPAPLPCAMKQYQPPNWKSLPPAPDLKLSKVENGIVISWKIESSLEDSYEEIASYQLYAYQETSQPPSTSLWKKIGDVKALPLPMACTLTQFMAGFKYYFAVRAVDIRSRFGPFSLPGSILLLNKNI